MGKFGNLSRRTLMKWGLFSGSLSLLPRASFSEALTAQVGGRSEDELYEGKNLPGGGQLDPRFTVSAFNPDADIVEVAERMIPFNPDSWHVEWKRAGEKNEKLGEESEKEGLKITASRYYTRAANFYQEAVIYLPEADPRMLPTYNKLPEMYNRAWKLVPPPFERMEIPYEGKTLPATLSKPRGNPSQKFPVVYGIGGADSRYAAGGGGDYVARGMAYLSVDGPGQGVPLRLKHIYAPPDSERVAKAVIDYIVTRPDVDANRIGMTGASMAGYTAPRSASGEKRIKACSVWSGAYSLVEDIFEYFPPIQDRLRWLCGAKDIAEAKKKMAEFTLEGRANQIECPLLVGYSKDDRIMDPKGALRLYEAATRSSHREMMEGIGHDAGRIRPTLSNKPPREIRMADWMAKYLIGPSA